MKFPITWRNNVLIHKTIEAFKKELSSYETSKGTIKFPINKPIAFELVRQIVEFRVRENLRKE